MVWQTVTAGRLQGRAQAAGTLFGSHMCAAWPLRGAAQGHHATELQQLILAVDAVRNGHVTGSMPGPCSNECECEQIASCKAKVQPEKQAGERAVFMLYLGLHPCWHAKTP
jgi:hypothetical protein